MRKTIPGFSRYAACTGGFLYSLDYKGSGKIQRLKTSRNYKGYLRTVLKSDDGTYKSVLAHRMVALAFIGDSEGLEVNHINGIKDDNRPSNIEYVTRQQNMDHAKRMGVIASHKGSKNGNSKLSEKDVLHIRSVAKNGGRYYGRKALAKQYEVSECAIKEIVNRRNNLWSHV